MGMRPPRRQSVTTWLQVRRLHLAGGAARSHCHGPAGERHERGQQDAQGGAGEPGRGHPDGQQVSRGKRPEGLGDAPPPPPLRRYRARPQ